MNNNKLSKINNIKYIIKSQNDKKLILNNTN